MAVLLALLSSALWGTSDYYGGVVSRRLPAIVVVAASQAAGLVTVGAVAVVLGEPVRPAGYLPWAVAAGLAGVTGLVCFYAALGAGTMGVVSPIAAVGIVVPVVLGLASGEQPSALQLAGIVVAVVGVVLASGPELRGRSRAAARPVLLALVAAVGFGLALWCIARGAETSTVMTLVTMRATSVVVLGTGLAVAAALGRGVARPRRPDVPAMAAVGVGDVLANLCFGVASTKGLVAVASVLGSLYPVVTVLLARLLLAERLARLQQLGVVGALGGVALIAAGGA